MLYSMCKWCVVGLMALTLFGGAIGGEVPLGDKDFYPTPERPIGFRGDNNGYFPGAKIVTEFYEAPPVEDTMEFINRRGDKEIGKFINLGDGPSKNIVWKVKLPSWGNTQPIVVGDKVFTLAEPDMMVCLSAKSGKILWTDSVNAWEVEAIERNNGEALSAEQKKAVDLARNLYEIWLAIDAVLIFKYHAGTCGRDPSYEEFMGIFNTFAEKELPAIVKRLNELDPAGNYDAEAKKMVAGVEFIENQELYNEVIDRSLFSIFRKIQELPSETWSKEAKTLPAFFNKVIELSANEEIKSDGFVRDQLLSMLKDVVADAAKFASFADKELPALYKRLNDLGKPVSQHDQNRITFIINLIKQNKLDTSRPGLKHHPLRRDIHVLKGHIHSRIRAITNTVKDKEVPLDLPWGHMVGAVMSVPISDGKHIYASFGQGMTVCWDLNGKRIWTRFFYQHNDWARFGHHIIAMQLARNILLDTHDYHNLRGLDTATGKTVWETKSMGATAISVGDQAHCGHQVMKLEDEYYLVTTLLNIIRMSDGKVVGSLPYKHRLGRGPNVTGVGDIVVKGAKHDNYTAPLTAFRLKVQPDGMVSAEQIWESSDRTSEDQTHIQTKDVLITQNRGSNIIDVNTGEIYVKDRRPNFGFMSNILAGNTLIWLASSNYESFWGGVVHGQDWQRRRADGKVTARFSTADLSNFKEPKMINENNILGGIEEPPVPHLEKWIPESFKNKNFWNASGGKPAHFAWSDTVIFPQGNRFFLRSVGYMYCIGDPSEEWHTPASAPPEARVAD